MRASYLSLKGIRLFAFGKYKNKSVKYVLQTDPDYIIWIKLNTKRTFSEEIENEIKRLNLLK
jgi:hypothetical protein